MKIQTRLILLICSLTIIFIFISLFQREIEKQRFISSFKIEEKEKSHLFNKLLALKNRPVERAVYDYTYWDAMVNFASKQDEETRAYLDDLITSYSFTTLWVYDKKQKLTYSVKEIQKDKKNILFSKDIIICLFKNSPFCHFFINTDNGIMEIYGATIHGSNDRERKNKEGYFFGGILWDEKYISELEVLTESNLEIILPEEKDKVSHHSESGTINFIKTMNSWDGTPIRYLNISIESENIKNFINYSNWMLIIFVFFDFFLLILLSFFLTLWIGLPLKQISKTLNTGNTEYINILKEKTSEFGYISQLIYNFFIQRKEFLNEIEERKKAQSSLQESANLYRMTIDSLWDALHVTVREMNIILHNKSLKEWKEKTGIKGEITGRNLLDIFPFLQETIIDEYNRVFTRGETIFTETKNTINGQEYITEVIKTPIIEEGKIVRILTVIHDITDKRNYQEHLNLRINMDKLLTAISKRFINISLSNIDEEIKHSMEITCNFFKTDMCFMNLYRDDLKTMEKEYVWHRDDINLLSFTGLSISAFTWAMDKLTQFEAMWLSNIRDLKENEMVKVYNIKSIAVIPLYIRNKLLGSLTFIAINNEIKWKEEHIVFLNMIGEIFINIMERKRADEEIRKLNKELEKKVLERTSQLELINRELKEEIQEREKIEKQIKSSLKEKDVLLKEVHHRVKNNLQIISSLLYLQSETIENKEDRRKFHESQNRIKSIALIHEKLYMADDLSNINFNGYIQSLLSHLFSTYHKSQLISLNTDVRDVSLSIDRAIPCGLIINELITNALKYAFPHDKKGNISIEFYKKDENNLFLRISDNGKGLPEDFNIEEINTLGLDLVYNLTKQLKGTLEIEKTKGTAFIIKIPA